MNKYLPFVIIVITFTTVVSPAYVSAITEKCYVQNIFHIFYADSAILCLDDRLTTVESSIGSSTDDTLCANVGSGSQVYKDGECNFRSITNSSRLWTTQNTNDVYLDATLKSHDSSSTVYQTVTKTNIGTSYVDIYSTLFDMEELVIIDFYNYTYCKANFLWDYVGTGTQQVRWIDQTNNANVLIESTTFNLDQTQTSTVFTAVPSWAKSGTGVKVIEWQGKSTVGTDDPIARGYHIICK